MTWINKELDGFGWISVRRWIYQKDGCSLLQQFSTSSIFFFSFFAISHIVFEGRGGRRKGGEEVSFNVATHIFPLAAKVVHDKWLWRLAGESDRDILRLFSRRVLAWREMNIIQLWLLLFVVTWYLVCVSIVYTLCYFCGLDQFYIKKDKEITCVMRYKEVRCFLRRQLLSGSSQRKRRGCKDAKGKKANSSLPRQPWTISDGKNWNWINCELRYIWILPCNPFILMVLFLHKILTLLFPANIAVLYLIIACHPNAALLNFEKKNKLVRLSIVRRKS